MVTILFTLFRSMDITLLLAKIWGPVILAVGIGIFVSRPFYLKIYRDLEKDALAVLIFGMGAMTMGIVHVMLHNVWGTFPGIVISLLGWGLLLKGTLFTIAPGLVDRAGDWWIKSKLIPTAGVFMILIGVYLSWVGYFAA